MNNYFQKLVSFQSSEGDLKINSEGSLNKAEFDFQGKFPETIKWTLVVDSFIKNPSEESELGDEKITPEELTYFSSHKDSYFNYDDPAIMAKVKDLTKGLTNQREKIRTIHNWVSSNITHILKISSYQSVLPGGEIVFDEKKMPDYRNVSSIFQAKIGHCRHISELFIGMCRAAGIPARMIWGLISHPDVMKETGISGEHFTAEVYDQDKQTWLYVEPQLAFHYGINQFWHIISSEEEINRNTKNRIDVVDLRWNEFYKLGHQKSMLSRIEFLK